MDPIQMHYWTYHIVPSMDMSSLQQAIATIGDAIRELPQDDLERRAAVARLAVLQREFKKRQV
jgi:hypothetical protein